MGGPGANGVPAPTNGRPAPGDQPPRDLPRPGGIGIATAPSGGGGSVAEREIEGLPEVLHAPLLEAVREIRENGLAVNLLASRLTSSSSRLDEPSVLAVLARGTQDIDLAVARDQAAQAEEALRAIGYHSLPNGKPGLERRGVKIDVLSLGRRPGEGEAAQLQGLTIRVATCAELIVLKAVAWPDRFRDDDLADIGTLALIDQIDGGTARQALEDGIDGRLRQDLCRDILRVAALFSRPDSPGPKAFVNEVVKSRATAEQLRSLDDWELVIATIVRDAVRTVLSGVGAVDG